MEQEHTTVQAGKLLAMIRQTDGDRSAGTADELLLFLYRLRDRCRIVRSSSSRFAAISFSFLHDLLYELESRPDETLRSQEWRTFVETLLSDLASGRIIVANK